MSTPFKHIGIMGRYHSQPIHETLSTLISFLQESPYEWVMEEETARTMQLNDVNIQSASDFAKTCDLMIVVGGDGSLLNASHCAAPHNTPILGINRGRLGFLTDIHPDQLVPQVSKVLNGDYIEEQRTLLTATLTHRGKILAEDIALNDIVVKQGHMTHMLEFEIYIDDKFVCSEHADGLITATPTGSTAYALSGGGPILHPQLNAIALVPMFSHTLSSRPLVISDDSIIKIVMADYSKGEPSLNFDGREPWDVPPQSEITMKKNTQSLRLIHPSDYHYFETLQHKLGWGRKLF